MDRMTEIKQHASPHCPCPHIAITPMTSSINHNSPPQPRRMNTATPRRHEPHSLLARRYDETTRDTRTEASTERRLRGSESRRHKIASPSAATRRTPHPTRRRAYQSANAQITHRLYPTTMTTRTIQARQMTMRTTPQRDDKTDKQHIATANRTATKRNSTRRTDEKTTRDERGGTT